VQQVAQPVELRGLLRDAREELTLSVDAGADEERGGLGAAAEEPASTSSSSRWAGSSPRRTMTTLSRRFPAPKKGASRSFRSGRAEMGRAAT